MKQLDDLINRLKKGLDNNSRYIKTIKYPKLLIQSLEELNELIGNDHVKESIALQISHLITLKSRSLQFPEIKEDNQMLNTVLYGPPGVGKTLIGEKLAKIWYSLGYLQGTPKKNKKLSSKFKDIFNSDNSNSENNNNNNNMDNSNNIDEYSDQLILFILISFIIFIIIIFIYGSYTFYRKTGLILTSFIIVFIIISFILIALYSSNHSDSSNINISSSFSDSKSSISSMPENDDIIKIVTRSDFVDKYVGWSDKKTLKVLNDNIGKVLFVDEAYSLVTNERDSFGIEILTVINLFLSQHPNEIIVIFAGYKDLMENGLFTYQPGLKRRFMWQFDCSGYTINQLFDIFTLQLNNKGWDLSDYSATFDFFKQNASSFPSFGGDTERLCFFSELEHSLDYINNNDDLALNIILPDQVRRGFIKLNQNNISNSSSNSSNSSKNDTLSDMIKLFQSSQKNNDFVELSKS